MSDFLHKMRLKVLGCEKYLKIWCLYMYLYYNKSKSQFWALSTLMQLLRPKNSHKSLLKGSGKILVTVLCSKNSSIGNLKNKQIRHCQLYMTENLCLIEIDATWLRPNEPRTNYFTDMVLLTTENQNVKAGILCNLAVCFHHEHGERPTF